MVWASGGGGSGALGDRVELVGQGVSIRRAPSDVHVDRVENLDLPDERRLRDLRHIRRDSSTTTRNCCKIRDITTTKGVRMDPRHRGVALTSTCGCRVAVAVDVVLGSLAEMPT